MEFLQAKVSILKGQLPCREEDAIQLAAILDTISNLYEKSLDFNVNALMEQYIPKTLHHKHTPDKWFSLVQHAVVTMENELGQSGPKPSREDLIRIYCQAVQQLPLYGCAVFRVQHIGNWPLPIEFDVAVGKGGLQLLDPISKDKIRSLPFTVLLKWDVETPVNSIPQLIITTAQRKSSLDDPILALQSAQSEDISLILREYNAVLKEDAATLQSVVDLTDPSDPDVLPLKKGEILNVVEKSGKWCVSTDRSSRHKQTISRR